ncbi:MAG TPA: RHS repeat-associated core domain-containing protein, partial [Gammaproteobacteria bacterium]|nr:RHS repeat-associated core domain-containing protein [Gammaproteobacteria bacterium]
KLVGTNGAVVWSARYQAFGEAQLDGSYAIENPLRFAGQYYDSETGLHYNYFRYYDPKVGRYLSSDPIGLAGGLNTYTYVENNPLRWSDPTGLIPPDWWDDKPQSPAGGPFGPKCGPEGSTLATWIPDISPDACTEHDKCYESCARECKGENCRLVCDTTLQGKNRLYGTATKRRGKKTYDDLKKRYGCDDEDCN